MGIFYIFLAHVNISVSGQLFWGLNILRKEIRNVWWKFFFLPEKDLKGFYIVKLLIRKYHFMSYMDLLCKKNSTCLNAWFVWKVDLIIQSFLRLWTLMDGVRRVATFWRRNLSCFDPKVRDCPRGQVSRLVFPLATILLDLKNPPKYPNLHTGK